MVQIKKRLCLFSSSLYVGESVRKVNQVKRKLARGAGQFTVWCVLAAPYTGGRLSIMHSAFLQMPGHQETPARVYGIATSKAEAKRLLVRISEDASAAGMEGRLKEYLDGKW